jgi:hypothetical protein
MPPQLTELLQTVRVTQPQEAGGLQVFGLRWENGNGLQYTTLDDALAATTLEVTEVSEGGNVPVLKVVNKGDTLVFLMAGEQLIGAKQNRVLNASIMVAAQSELPIPVSCVEAGRWRYRSHKFASSGTSSHAMLRKMMSLHAHEGYRSQGTPTSRQGEVWGEVSRKLDKMGSRSASAALYQTYEDHRQRLDDVLGKLHSPEDCSGVVFAFAGKIAGADLFDKPATLAKLWPKLVRSHTLDVLEVAETQAAPLTADAVQQWLRSAAGARVEPFKSPGLGDDVRLEGDSLVGAGLVVDDHPVHVELFVNDNPATGAEASAPVE